MMTDGVIAQQRSFPRSIVPIIINRRSRGAIDALIALSVWGLLIALATGGGNEVRIYVERAHVTEALTAATLIKQEMVAAYASTGHWPESTIVPAAPDATPSATVSDVHYEDGAFTFELTRKTNVYHLSFRAAVSEASPQSPVLWLCGYADSPIGYKTFAANRTDIPAQYLPSACR